MVGACYYTLNFVKRFGDGSPASTAIPSRIETVETTDIVDVENNNLNDSGTTNSLFTDNEKKNNDEVERTSSEEIPLVTTEKMKERRDLLHSRLSSYKQEKLKRKIPNDTQMIAYAQEDLKIKGKNARKTGDL